MRTYGSTGTPLAGHHSDKDDEFAGLRTRPWGRPITEHFERARARRSPLPELAPLNTTEERQATAAPATKPEPEPKPKPKPLNDNEVEPGEFGRLVLTRIQAGHIVDALRAAATHHPDRASVYQRISAEFLSVLAPP